MPDEVKLTLSLRGRLLEKYRKVSKGIIRANKAIASSIDKVTRASKGLKAASSAVQKGLIGTKNSLLDFAKRFGPAAIAVALLTAGIMGLKKSFEAIQKMTQEFEKTLSKIKAIVRPTADGFALLAAKAKELGRTTAFAASQAGIAFVELGKLGFITTQILAAAPGVIDLAAVAEIGMGEAATQVAGTLNAFSMAAEESTRVVDVMASSFTSSALDATKLNESIKFAGPVAGSLKVSFEETTGALAELSNNMIDGSMAGTALRRVMLLLFDETSKAGKMIGVTADDTRTLTERLEALQAKNLSPAKIKDTFGLLAATAAGVLIRGNQQVKEFTENYREADGVARDMADTMLDNVAGATVILKSAQEGLAIAIGESFGVEKQATIEHYTKLVGQATVVVEAHSQEVKALGGMWNNLRQKMATELFTKFAELIDWINRIKASIFILQQNFWIAVRGMAQAVNWLAEIFAGSKIVDALGLPVAEDRIDDITEKIKKLGAEAEVAYGRAADAMFPEFAVKGKGPAAGAAAVAPKTGMILPLRMGDLEKQAAAELQRQKNLAKEMAEIEVQQERERIAKKAARSINAQEKEAERVKQAATKLMDDLNVMALDGQAAEQQRLLNWFDQKEAMLIAAGESTLLLEAVYGERQEAIKEKFREENIKNAEAEKDRLADIEKAKVIANQQANMQMLSNFSSALSGSKKFSAAQKVIAATEAGYSAYLSSQKMFEAGTKFPYPANIVMPWVLSASAIAAGLARVAAIKSAATGADFVTRGPQIIRVGDNPTGRERVQVTPIGSPNLNGPQGQAIHIENFNINGMSNAEEIFDTFQERLAGLAQNQNEIEVLQVGG